MHNLINPRIARSRDRYIHAAKKKAHSKVASKIERETEKEKETKERL